MQVTSPAFKQNAARAMADVGQQKALGTAKGAFLKRRAAAVAALPEFERLRDIGRDIKNHALANLDHYLERYAEAVERAGGKVHWCSSAEDARADGDGDADGLGDGAACAVAPRGWAGAAGASVPATETSMLFAAMWWRPSLLPTRSRSIGW